MQLEGIHRVLPSYYDVLPYILETGLIGIVIHTVINKRNNHLFWFKLTHLPDFDYGGVWPSIITIYPGSFTSLHTVQCDKNAMRLSEKHTVLFQKSKMTVLEKNETPRINRCTFLWLLLSQTHLQRKKSMKCFPNLFLILQKSNC